MNSSTNNPRPIPSASSLRQSPSVDNFDSHDAVSSNRNPSRRGMVDRRSARRVLSPKTAVNISTFKVRSLNSPNDWKKLELVGSCELYNIGVLAIQVHRQNAIGDFSNAALLYENLGKGWQLIVSPAVRNTIGASQGGVGFILNEQAQKSLTKAQIISSRICALEFQGNLKTTILSCYSPTNVSPQSEVESFYNDLNRFRDTVPPDNFLII